MANTESNTSNRFFIVVAVMLAAVIEIIDSTIVNVSLPQMMGALGADTDQISWVLTSYIVSAAIFMPLTGFLVNRLGRKKLLLLNIAGFMLSSMLCGLSANLFEIVCFRTLQGVFGSSLVPLSQYILRDTFNAKEQGKAMSIWGIGIMAGPILGPTLGGYITEALNWRWIFYINVPICIIAFLLSAKVIKESTLVKQHLDWQGLTLMVLAIGSLQLFLDRGNTDDWFSSNTIIFLLISTIIFGSLFIYRGLRVSTNIINLNLFKDLNFRLSTLILGVFAGCMFGGMVLQPIMLQTLFKYSTINAGLIMAPRGISSAISMAIVARLVNRYDPRYLLSFGLTICAWGTWLLGAITLQTSSSIFVITGLIQGFGIGFFFVPLSTIVFSTLEKSATAEAAGLYTFGRSIGTSAGISAMTTLLTRHTQANWNILGSHINHFNSSVQHWLHAAHLTLANPATITLLAQQLYTQAAMVSYTHIFALVAVLLFGLGLIVWFLQPPPLLHKQETFLVE